MSERFNFSQSSNNFERKYIIIISILELQKYYNSVIAFK
jgi:hypothetical protein